METFVLVHGSYQGGWIWQHVANLCFLDFRDEGNRVMNAP